MLAKGPTMTSGPLSVIRFPPYGQTKGLQNVVGWFLDGDDNPDFHQNLIITFLAHLQCSLKFACKFIPWYLH